MDTAITQSQFSQTPAGSPFAVAISNRRGEAGLEHSVAHGNKWQRPDGSLKFTLEQRFWSKVDKRGPNECWPWTAASQDHDGRGYLFVGGDRRQIMASRAAWEIMRGPIPSGMCVCHHCDNPNCCNAEQHMFLGTRADNVHDMDNKGRRINVKSSARLTPANVREIRLMYFIRRRPYAEVGGKYGVSREAIRNAVARNTWQDVP